MIAMSFSKEIVVVKWVFIMIEFSWLRRCSVGQTVVTRKGLIATIARVALWWCVWVNNTVHALASDLIDGQQKL